MQLRYFERLASQVNTGDLCARSGHGISQNPAAATDIQHLFVVQWRPMVDPLQSQRIDLVQWPELTVDIPPSVSQFRKFRQLGGIYVRSVHEVIVKEIEPTAIARGKAGKNKGSKKTPHQAGFGSTEGYQFLRAPTTSISTRRFLARPSLVLLSATGCFSPLPSV